MKKGEQRRDEAAEDGEVISISISAEAIPRHRPRPSQLPFVSDWNLFVTITLTYLAAPLATFCSLFPRYFLYCLSVFPRQSSSLPPFTPCSLSLLKRWMPQNVYFYRTCCNLEYNWRR